MHDLTVANAKLETEVQVKSDMLAQLITVKRDAAPENESFQENQIELNGYGRSG